jgi:hypothetical protein
MKGVNAEQEALPNRAKIYQLCVPWVSDQRFLIKIRKTEQWSTKQYIFFLEGGGVVVVIVW